MFDFEGSNLEKFYRGIEPITVGTIISFQQLADVGFDVKHNRGLIYAANKYLLENHNKMLISQRNVGYKMAEPTEQMKHSWKRKTKARRQITKAVLETTHIDTSKLTADERRLLTDREIYLKQQLKGLRKLNIASQKVAKRQIAIQEEVAAQIERLLNNRSKM